MSHDFVLDPTVVKDLTSYSEPLPFKNVPKPFPGGNFKFEETIEITSAEVKPDKQGVQTIVEVHASINGSSPNGNTGVKFKSAFWLNNDICSGTARPADLEENVWKKTQAALRTLKNMCVILGLDTVNPVAALTAFGATLGSVPVEIRVYQKRDGNLGWSIERVVFPPKAPK